MDHVYSRRLARSSYLPPLTLSISPFEISVARDKLTGLVAHYIQKDQEIEKKKENNNFMKLWRTERDEIHVKGVTARKAERDRVKRLKEIQKGPGAISVEMNEEIPDPEALWKATNEV